MVVGLLFWFWIGGLLIIVGGLGIARFVCVVVTVCYLFTLFISFNTLLIRLLVVDVWACCVSLRFMFDFGCGLCWHFAFDIVWL